MNKIVKALLVVCGLSMLLSLGACSSHNKRLQQDATSGSSTSSGAYNNSAVSGGYQDRPVVSDSVRSGNGLTSVFYFGFNQDELTPKAMSDLQAQAERLRGKSDQIRLEGHADELGSREYNIALGERRAKAVANYLKTQGVSASRFDIVSYGEEKPAVDGSTSRAQALNRRVELK